MELVGIIAFFLLIGVVAVVATFVIDRAQARAKALAREQAIKEAKEVRWEVVTTSALSDVLVGVRRHRDMIVVARIPNTAKDWEDKVIAAQAEATRRAAVLNAEL